MSEVFKKLHFIHRPLLVLLAASAVLCAFFSPLKVVAGTATLAIIIGTFWNPRLAILFLVVLIPFEPFLLKFVPDDIYVYARYFSEILIYIVFASVCVKQLGRWAKGETRGKLPLVFAVIALLVIDALISAFINATSQMVALLGIRQIVRFMVLFASVAILEFDRVFARRVVVLLVSIAIFQSALGLVQAAIGAPLDQLLIPGERKVLGDVQLTTGTNQFWESGQRVFATMGRYDQLGTFLCLVLLLGIGMLYQYRKPFLETRNLELETKNSTSFRFQVSSCKFQAAFFFLLGISALVLTYSRASWFGFALGLFVIGWFVMKDKKILIAYALAVSAFTTYLLFSWGVVSQLIDTPRQSVLERLSESISPERWRGEYYGLGRMYYIVHTPADIVSRSPLFGVGPGSYGGGTAAALRYTEQYNRAHLPFGIYGTEGYIDNNWLSLWGELGTVGLGLYIFLLVLLVRTALRVFRSAHDPLTRSIALGFVGIAAAVTLQAFLATYLEVRTLAFYFWLLAGIVVSSSLALDRTQPHV